MHDSKQLHESKTMHEPLWNVCQSGMSEEERHALVPLRCNANENSFFGAEGIGSKDSEDVIAVSADAEHQTFMQHDFHGSNSFYAFHSEMLADKENSLFSINVDLNDTLLAPHGLHLDPKLHSNAHHRFDNCERDEELSLIHEEKGEESSEVEDSEVELSLEASPSIRSQATLSKNTGSQAISSKEATQQDVPASPNTSVSIFISSDISEESIYCKRPPPKKKRKYTKSKSFRAATFNEYKLQKKAGSDEAAKAGAVNGALIQRQPRFEGDMYTACWQRGKGDDKEGLCPLCPPELWLRIKQSSYWYHMNYHHGINAVSGRPYEAPSDFQVERIKTDSDDGMLMRLSGKCEVCQEWVIISNKYLNEEERAHEGKLEELIDIEGVNMLTWYKHTQRCHKRK